jgi:hypothetical protein
VPYLGWPVAVFPGGLRRRCGPHEAIPHWAGAEPWRCKVAAVGRYTSQHPLLWPGASDVGAMLNGPAEVLGRAFGDAGRCELFWRPGGH